MLYDHTSAISITASIFFCEKWSDFCYPSDVLLIVNNNIVLLYYEDTLYGPLESFENIIYINGNQIPNNKIVNGKQIGISKSEYNQLTHFNNID